MTKRVALRSWLAAWAVHLRAGDGLVLAAALAFCVASALSLWQGGRPDKAIIKAGGKVTDELLAEYTPGQWRQITVANDKVMEDIEAMKKSLEDIARRQGRTLLLQLIDRHLESRTQLVKRHDFVIDHGDDAIGGQGIGSLTTRRLRCRQTDATTGQDQDSEQ